MALKRIVKINEVNNLTDARYVAGMGVDMIGFNIDRKSPHFVGEDKYREIRGWISGVQIVGEVGVCEEAEIRSLIEQFHVDLVQTSSVDTFKALKKMQFPAIFKAYLYEYETLEFLKMDKMHPDYLLVEKHGEDISDMESSQLRHLCVEFNVLLGFGVTAENVEKLMESYDLTGFALFGGDEVRPGYREFDDLADILEKLEFDV
jgi:phosphoribosylanthranilate isomerase